MSDRSRYPHVWSADAPSMVRHAAALYGVKETPGKANSQTIMGWAKEIEAAMKARDLASRTLGYTNDAIPWCGLFIGVVAVRAGWADQMPTTPLWARAWLQFGQKPDAPAFGDVMVFGRQGGGHVAIYVGEDSAAYHILGGNQSDAVNITRISKSRFLGARRPKWRIAQPASVRPIRVGAFGVLSKNEA